MARVAEVRELVASTRLRPYEAISLMLVGLGLWIVAAVSPSPTWAEGWGGWLVTVIGISLIVTGAVLLVRHLRTDWPQGLHRETIQRASASGLAMAEIKRDDPEHAAGGGGVRGSPRTVSVPSIEDPIARAYQDRGPEDNAAVEALVQRATTIAPPSVAGPMDGLGPRETAVDPRVRGTDEPPVGWTGQYWQGKQLLKCPWDDYRTIDHTAYDAHRDTHTDPPSEAEARAVSVTPWPWAITPIHYLGDGAYIGGVPADPDHTMYTTKKRADELVATGLYGLGPRTTEKHAFSGAVGRTIVCTCGFEASTVSEFQSHLSLSNPQ